MTNQKLRTKVHKLAIILEQVDKLMDEIMKELNDNKTNEGRGKEKQNN